MQAGMAEGQIWGQKAEEVDMMRAVGLNRVLRVWRGEIGEREAAAPSHRQTCAVILVVRAGLSWVAAAYWRRWWMEGRDRNATRTAAGERYAMGSPLRERSLS